MGPYVVTKKVTDVTYVIQKSPKDKVLVVNIDKLKKCVTNNVTTCVNTNKMNSVLLCLQVFSWKGMEPEERQFPCELCDRSFKRKHDLHRHDTAVHLRVKTICHLCDLPLSSRGAFKRHVKRFHGTLPRGDHRPRREVVRSLPSIPAGPTEGVLPTMEHRSRRVRWEPDEETEPQYVPAAPTIPRSSNNEQYRHISHLIPFEMLRSPSPPRGDRRVVMTRPPAMRMSKYVPTEAEQASLLVRMEVWVRRISREKTELNEHEYLMKYGDQDDDLGFVGNQTVRQLIRLQNRSLIMRPTEVGGDAVSPEVPIPTTKEKAKPTIRYCTASGPAKKNMSKKWEFPTKASATIPSEVMDETDGTPKEVIDEPPTEKVVVQQEVIEKETQEPSESSTISGKEMTFIEESPLSQLLVEDPASPERLPPSVEVLVEESTMQFQALCLPADEAQEYDALPDLDLAMEVEVSTLNDEVSAYLCAPDLEVEGCFAFDLEDVIGKCVEEL